MVSFCIRAITGSLAPRTPTRTSTSSLGTDAALRSCGRGSARNDEPQRRSCEVSANLDALIEQLAGQLCNWGRWGEDDELGALNLITAEKRLEASACVKDGALFSLGFELRPDMPQPPGSGRLNPQHYMTETAADTAGAVNMTAGADDVLLMAVHGGTHWDALSHIFHRDKMYGGASASLVSASAGAGRTTSFRWHGRW